MTDHTLMRFKQAQERDYELALSEIRNGYKASHWIWYIFPQLKRLGFSDMSKYYGIAGLDEAREYLADPYLRKNLIEISSALLDLETSDARTVMGSPDDRKLKSSMTLFLAADPEEEVFRKVLEKFFDGRPDYRTLGMLGMKGDI